MTNANQWRGTLNASVSIDYIKAIQSDALRHALGIACTYDLPSSIRDVLREEIDKLQPDSLQLSA